MENAASNPNPANGATSDPETNSAGRQPSTIPTSAAPSAQQPSAIPTTEPPRQLWINIEKALRRGYDLEHFVGARAYIKYLLSRLELNERQCLITALLASREHYSVEVEMEEQIMTFSIQPANLFLSVPLTSNSLVTACQVGDLEGVQVLVVYGRVDVNAESQENWSPLCVAIRFANTEVAKYLLSKGANPNKKMTAGREQADDNPVEKVLNLCAGKVLVGGGVGCNAVHTAATHGNVEVLVELLQAGIDDINARTTMFGSSALHLAADAGQRNIVPVLLANGAEINSKDDLGQTPLDCAYAGKYSSAVVKLLEQHGGVRSTPSEQPQVLSSGDQELDDARSELLNNVQSRLIAHALQTQRDEKKQKRELERCWNPECTADVASADLRQCSKCRVAKFCSRECQKAHFPEHRKICVQIAKRFEV